ncbi:MAG TPA: FAD/NAD(P)-binding oxidoreductase [bacterium]|jgi:sulfide:quinone oxidoreductase|nr:FAD/NAD(P)-binding oxidoreductase [bacterium]
MARPRVLVLGGGFGGLSAAYELHHLVGDRVDLQVIDASPTFMMGLRKLWLLDRRGGRAEGTRDRTRFAAGAVPVRPTQVEAIDLDARQVIADGDRLSYDFLIVALGAQARPDLIPGGVEGGANLYAVDDAEALGAQLASLARGRIVVAIAGLPYKCPPAPYEAAFLIDDLLRRAGRRDACAIDVLTPQPMSLPVAGPAACARAEGTMTLRQIQFRPKTLVARVEAKRVLLSDGSEIPADVVIYVPAHRPPAAVKESGLTGGAEWIRPDPETLMTSIEGVFAIGDVTEIPMPGGLALPKAGVFAERQGQVVARNVAALVDGRPPEARFDGRGYCFLEVGEGQASMIEGAFLADPPDISVLKPAPEHLAAKVAFERERLERWFG